MIDRGHDLPIGKQAEVLRISRGTVYPQDLPVSAARHGADHTRADVWCVVHCLSDFEFMAAHSVVDHSMGRG
jgi:hypothetical protein